MGHMGTKCDVQTIGLLVCQSHVDHFITNWVCWKSETLMYFEHVWGSALYQKRVRAYRPTLCCGCFHWSSVHTKRTSQFDLPPHSVIRLHFMSVSENLLFMDLKYKKWHNYWIIHTVMKWNRIKRRNPGHILSTWQSSIHVCVTCTVFKCWVSWFVDVLAQIQLGLVRVITTLPMSTAFVDARQFARLIHTVLICYWDTHSVLPLCGTGGLIYKVICYVTNCVIHPGSSTWFSRRR